MYHFSSSNWWPQVGAWEHAEWLIGARPRGYYETHKRLLQQMHWKGPDGRWLLKTPQHLFDLPGLFDVYPDARVVWTHRDPVSTFSSLSFRPYFGNPSTIFDLFGYLSTYFLLSF